MCVLSTGLLRLGLTCCVRGCIIRKHADGFDLFEILEGRMIKIDQFAADDEMEVWADCDMVSFYAPLYPKPRLLHFSG